MRVTIGNKLGLGFGGVLLTMTLSAVIVFLAVDRMNDSADRMTSRHVPELRANDDLLIAVQRSAAALRGLLLLGDDPAQASFFESEVETAQKDAGDAFRTLEELYAGTNVTADREHFETIRQRLPEILAAQREVINAARQGREDLPGDASAAVNLLESKALPLQREIVTAASALRAAAADQVTGERTVLDQARTTARMTLLVATLIALAIGFTVAVLMSRRIVGAIQALLSAVQTVSQGDLTDRPLAVATRDEVGDLTGGFNQMVASLRLLVTEAAATSREVATSSAQIAAGAQEQLSSLNETASSLNEITTTAEEFKATMQEFADRAKAVHEAADETSRRADEGQALSQDSAARIEQVRGNALAAGESVLHLAGEMQRIGEVTASVNEIAEQTKLLALNASIEAARAGEEGRGFAVVALQVRELANQSKEAAGRIESLVVQAQKSMQAVVSKIEDGGRLSDDSAQIVRQVADSFGEIAHALQQTRDAMAQINSGARQQEAGITELVGSITQIDAASKESVAAAEQTQRSIVAIDDRIRGLDGTISRFRT